MKHLKKIHRIVHVRQVISCMLIIGMLLRGIPCVFADSNPASNALPTGVLPGSTIANTAGNFDYSVPNQLTVNNAVEAQRHSLL